MIIWIASYPKSGNTWIRALLSYYFFSRQKKFEFEILKHIPNFNVGDFINNTEIIKSDLDFARNALNAQKIICERFKVNCFFKTHNALSKLEGKIFTDNSVSLGCIYIVRDPRNVITSYKNFENRTYENILSILLDSNAFLYSNKKNQEKFNIKGMEIIGSWADNYNSWVNNKIGIPVCLIKYEDLLNNTMREFEKIIEFLKKINHEKMKKFDFKRAEMTVLETSFENLKKLEKEKGFIENKERKDKSSDFFNQGKLNNWKNILPKEISQKIEEKFYKEMIELSYL